MATKKYKPKKLTIKKERFCQEYVIDGNASAAMRRAGYSKGVAASEYKKIMTDPLVIAKIDELMQVMQAKAEICSLDVLADLNDLATACLEDWLRIDDKGEVTLIPANKRPPRARKALKKFKSKSHYNKAGELLGTDFEIELHDQVRCKELVGKHLGMFVDRSEVEIVNGDAKARMREMFDSMTIQEKQAFAREERRRIENNEKKAKDKNTNQLNLGAIDV